jgi:hypothetical protein
LRAIAIAASLLPLPQGFKFLFFIYVACDTEQKTNIWIIEKQPRSLENIYLETLFVTKPYESSPPSKFSLSTVEDSCETNPLLQRTVIQIFGHIPFNQISNPEYSFTYVTSERTPKSTEILRTVLQKQFTVDFLSLLSL